MTISPLSPVFLLATFLGCSQCFAAEDSALPRPQPLHELAVEQTINVADFGAKPDGNQDATQAIQAALDAAQKSGRPCKVQFAKGTYRIGGGAGKHVFVLKEAKNLVIDGAGALLLQTDPTVGIAELANCQNVIIQNFAVDYAPLPFTQGIIKKVQAKPAAIDFEIAAGYPSMDDPQFTRANGQYWGVALDPVVPGRILKNAPTAYQYQRTEKLSPGLFRLYLRANPSQMQVLKVGGRFSSLARTNAPLIGFVSCRNVTAQDITNYASAGGHYTGVYNSCVNILRCRSLIKAGRWKGGNADAIHMQASRNGGPWVEGCEFDGISDDNICIYNGRPVFIRSIVSPKELILGVVARKPGPNDVPSERAFAKLSAEIIQPGEHLAFLEPQSGKLLAESDVERVNVATGQVILKQPVTGLKPGLQLTDTQVYNTSVGGHFVVRNNRVTNVRRFGIFTKASDGLIEGNHLEGVSATAIMVENEPSWPEGLRATNLIIRNNEIVDCGFDELFVTTPHLAQISILAMDFNKKPVADAPDFHRDILLEGNKIEKWSKLGFYLSNVTNLTVKNTSFGAPREKGATLLFKGPLGKVALEPFHCEAPEGSMIK